MVDRPGAFGSVQVSDLGWGGSPAARVHAVRLQVGRLSATVWSYGATLVELTAPDRAGGLDNVVLRLPRLRDYEQREDDARLGATMGRFCRIVADGRLPLDGRVHQLDRNAGRDHLHGGRHGFDRRIWSLVGHGADQRSAHVVLQLISPDGDQGYPGEVVVRASFELTADAALTVSYEATTSAPTLVGLTLHGYWNLAGGGRIDDHLLQVGADAVVRTDPGMLPTGGLTAVVGGPLDHRTPRRVGAERLDHCFVTGGAATRRPVAILTHPGSGRILTVETAAPGLAVYTADQFRRRTRGGICLQSTALPGVGPGGELLAPVLRPDAVYRHVVVYRCGADVNESSAEVRPRP